MATEGTTRPDEPLRQYSEEKSAPSSVGTHEVQDGTAVDTYSVPGTAQPDSEADEVAREHEENEQEAAEVNAQPVRSLPVADTRSPEVNYLTRDNIVYPDPRPEEAARVERFARATLDQDDESVALAVEQDSTDLHDQLTREGRRDVDVPVQEQAAEIREDVDDQREDVDPVSDNAVGPQTA